MSLKRLNNLFVQQNTLHLVTRPILIFARCFGLYPVSGLLERSPQKLRFSIKSPYTLIVIFGLAGQSCMTVLALLNLFESGVSPRTFQKFITNALGLACSVMILRLAKNWPNVVHEVTQIEKSLPKFNQKNINLICNVAAIIIFVCATLDFILSIKFYSRLTDACPQGESLSLMESYYRYTTPAAAARIPFNVFNFLSIQVIFIQVALVCNFTDVFIMIISMYLSVYFNELNDLVKLYKDKSPSIWKVLRVHYTKVTCLVKIIDDNISSLVLFSFGGNMIVICIQLFKILRRDLAHATGSNCDETKLHETLESVDRSLYYNFSLLFSILRALVTALIATRVHTTAKAPLNSLYEVPSCCFDSEARRFAEQVEASTIALSGQHFFYVTRKMILSMVASIITYELVLLQFSK